MTATISLRKYGYKLANPVEERRKSLLEAMQNTNCMTVIYRLHQIKRHQKKYETIISQDIMFCTIYFHEQNQILFHTWHVMMSNLANIFDDTSIQQLPVKAQTKFQAMQQAMERAQMPNIWHLA